MPQTAAETVAEDAWLNRIADEAEDEGFEGALCLDGMAALVLGRERRESPRPGRGPGGGS
ncbi:hypothetical protein [Kitasatospora sp. NPDC088548]|uniref:hypothetical protein n=1 Tax=Kitasatospora sp. NPDC088548 TaxID=3364075 RepID=UPI00382C023E